MLLQVYCTFASVPLRKQHQWQGSPTKASSDCCAISVACFLMLLAYRIFSTKMRGTRCSIAACRKAGRSWTTESLKGGPKAQTLRPQRKPAHISATFCTSNSKGLLAANITKKRNILPGLAVGLRCFRNGWTLATCSCKFRNNLENIRQKFRFDQGMLCHHLPAPWKNTDSSIDW